ncbi:MAG: transposase family protein, partial [Proteobacteria bacterium]|nr:transposase family protein [Pseudomonadota bacterium]
TLECLRNHFFWDTMTVDVHRFCNTCLICITRKGQRKPIRLFLRPIPSPARPMEVVSIDILTLDGTESGNKKALVGIDLNSKFLFFKPMPDETAATLAQTFVDMFSECGLPRAVLSDRGTNLRSAHFNDLCGRLGVSHNYTTTYHPQGNPMEHANKTVLDRLSTAILASHLPWDKVCSSMVHAYNATVH